MKAATSCTRGFAKKALSAALAVTLAVGLAPSLPAIAQDDDGARLATLQWDGTAKSELPIWAQDTGEDAGMRLATQASGEVSKSKFDLRTDRNPSPVSPVRTQSPYASCWSFGGIAAAETSIMSDFGVKDLDLSEKHLLWFAMHPITKADDPTQVGEGVHVFKEDQDKNRNAAYIPSNPVLVSTLFSSGVGPVSESAFPYRGKEGLTEYDLVLKQPDKWKQILHENLLKTYGSESALLDVIKSKTEYETVDAYLASEHSAAKAKVEAEETPNCYSDADDWTVPATDSNGNSNRTVFEGYTLVDGNIMPDFTKTEGGATVPNAEGMLAVKQELLRGHGVTCIFCADTSRPGQESQAKYISPTTWAHYTYENVDPNHSVCIVGWDDNYSKDNFNKGTATVGGKSVSKAPAGNGAWIVRNSWGCKDGCGKTPDGQVIGKDSWGVDGSGYFYISYYDKSLMNGESFTFSDDLDDVTLFAHQYDFMPAIDDFFTLTGKNEKDLIATSNVFTADSDEKIVSVSTRTSTPNSRVTFSMYRLNKNAKAPDDGILVGKQSLDIGYAGFHRVTLNKPFYVHKGEKFSVISSIAVTTEAGGKKYQIAANTAPGKDKAIQNEKAYYCESTINKGESYLYDGGKWIDWSAMQGTSQLAGWMMSAGKTGDVLDNFNIKAYGLTWDGKHAKHTWDAGTVTKAAKIGVAGKRTFACPECGATRTEAIAALPGGIVGKTYKAGGNTYKVTNNAKSTVAFRTAKKAKKVSVPATVKIKGKTYKVTSIAAKAFAPAKKKLTTVTIGKNVATIGKSAFASCAKLRTVKGGAAVKTVHAKAFNGCKALVTCKPLASKKLAAIGSSALKGCKKLTSLTVKSKKLTKKGVKKSLSGSSVKTVKVNVGKAKADKTYAKKYKKLFTKANCGKKVTVKA